MQDAGQRSLLGIQTLSRRFMSELYECFGGGKEVKCSDAVNPKQEIPRDIFGVFTVLNTTRHNSLH